MTDELEALVCPRCHKAGWMDRVTRTGKDPSKRYEYYRYRHKKDGRTGRHKTCYVRVKE